MVVNIGSSTHEVLVKVWEMAYLGICSERAMCVDRSTWAIRQVDVAFAGLVGTFLKAG